jgi:dihydroorotase
MEEKSNPYFSAPSGLPLIQHTLNVMLGFYQEGKISLEKIIEKMCHAPTDCFGLKERGYLREGYYADLALVDLEEEWTVNKSNILYKCGWSPLEDAKMKGRVTDTYVNGHLVYQNGKVLQQGKGMRLMF